MLQVWKVVQAVYDYFKNYDLRPTMINELSVKHNLEIIMVDGKISTLLSQTTNSAHCCTVCDCSPKQMNKLLGLLLFISHCRKIVYDIDAEGFWQCRNKEHKATIAIIKTFSGQNKRGNGFDCGFT